MKKSTSNIRKARYKKSALISLISGILILLAVNIISSFLYFRIDLTQDKRHTLSPATIHILKNLQDKIYIKVYLKGEMYPADYKLFANKVRETLEEMKTYSSSNIIFEFIDPVEGKSRQEIAEIFGEFNHKGLRPIPISKESSAGFSTQYIVPGAILSYRGKEYPTTLVVSDPSGNDYWMTYSSQELEYNIMAAIRNLTQKQRPKVAFLQGHGELDFLTTSWVEFQLTRFYSVEQVVLNEKINSLREIAIEDSILQTVKPLGNKYDVIVVAHPILPFSDIDKFLLDQHVMRGGKILWLIDETSASLDSLQNSREMLSNILPLRLNDLFFKYGVRLNINILQDLSCRPLPFPMGMIGDQPQYKLMPFPYCLNITNFSTHPITRTIKQVKMDFAGSIDFVGSQNLQKTILMTTSAQTKTVPSPSIVSLNVALSKPNIQEFSYKYLPVAVLIEGNFESAFDGILPAEFDTIKEFGFAKKSPVTRQIFVSDGDIIRNFIDYKRNQPYPAGYDIYTGTQYDNTEFLVNCVNYLCADDDLLSIRAKNFKIGSLDKTKVLSKASFYAVVNIAIPLIIIILIGIILNLVRRRKYRKV
jgi:ABC-2 type transport system permease protein